MAHNIEIVNGVASFAECIKKERAWHGLGQVFDRPMFVNEALKACHADFRVEMRPIMPIVNDMSLYEGLNLEGEEVEGLIVPDVMATMRMDTHQVLGIVSSNRYSVVQNEDAFRFIDTLCSGRDVDRNDRPVIESCGVLGHGERIFITCKFPEDIILDSKTDDRIERYIVFTTSHDGTGAVKCLSTSVRVVCNNTLNFAIKNNFGKLSLKHTKNIGDKLDLTNQDNAELVYATIGCEKQYNEFLKAELERLRSLRITKKQVMDIVANVVLPEDSLKVWKETNNIEHEDISTRSKNIFNGMVQAIHEGVGQDIMQSGNALWLLNGITSYYQNNVTYKNDEVKFSSIMTGNVFDNVKTAYEKVLKLA